MIELVGEIGINANADLTIAKKLIDIAYSAGFQYVKFQKRTLESCYTEEELNTPRESPWGTTTREQKIGIEFTIDQYRKIDRYCKEKGIKWFASPWDIKSIFHITNLGSCFIKVPSALATNHDYLKMCVKTTTLPIILSTGMCTEGMIDDAVRAIPKDRLYAILHCTSTYPSKPEEQNLSYIKVLKDKYPWTKIGFSNHFPGIPFMIGAAALGAEMIEMHVTLSRLMYGSDQASSLEPHATFKIGKYIRGMEKGLGTGKKRIYDSEIPIMAKLRKG
jgi:N-acetylneuraminate synthase